MDAEKLLKAYGWSGSGSLDSHNGAQSRGLSKPLLISKKVDVLGVGLNKHAAVSDQWWMRAYDSGLKDLGTGKKSTLSQVREKGMFAGGLYGRFVKGESEGGTIQQWNEDQKKRKREDDDSGYDSLGKKVKTEVAEKVKKMVSRRVDAFTQEARKRGLLEIRVVKDRVLEGKVTGKSVESLYGEEAVARVFKDAGLAPSNKEDRKKQDKYDREKRVRRLRQAAKSFVISQLTQEEQAQLEVIDYIRDKTHEEKQRDRRRTRIEKAEAKAAKKAAKEQKRLQDLEMKAWEKGMTSEAYLQYRKDKKKAKKQDVLLKRYYGREEKTEELLEVEAELGDMEADDQRQSGVSQVSQDEEQAKSGSNQVIDREGNVRYTVDPEVPVPLDPSIWEGIGAKSLPKRVREARRQWMENQREAKKAADGAGDKEARSKDARKIARQEAVTMKILSESRKEKKGKGGGKKATIEGIEGLPLVDVTTKHPEQYTTEEMAAARTLARKVLKEEKRKKKAGKASA